MSTITVPSPSRTAREWVPAQKLSWPVYAVLFSSIGIVTGLIWDISWHRTIGRDTFWSPPHLLEQVAAAVAGLSCGWLVLHTTFRGSEEDRARSVRFWGFRGPAGAWVCIWGTIAMISSAPFDNWWHNAYGLDVRIISPPHMVLAAGMLAIQIGAMLMTLAVQNRAPNPQGKRLALFFAFSAGILLTMHTTVLMESAAFANQMHGSQFYQLTSLEIPAILIATALPSRLRWPATTTAAIYIAIMLVLIWTLQLFPAQPRLAPIFNPVTHMVPPPFPLLVVVPAFALDLLLRRWRSSDWLLAPVAGVVYVVLMVAVHWFFSDFLLSSNARNFFFAADQWDYVASVGDWRYQRWNLDRDAAGQVSKAALFNGLVIAAAIATISARIGLAAGRFLSRVQR